MSLRGNFTMSNSTTDNADPFISDSLILIVNLTCCGVLSLILIALGFFTFIRYRKKHGESSDHTRNRPDCSPGGDAPRVDSFRNKRQRDQEFPYINYGIKYLLESSSGCEQKEKEVIYDVPRVRGKKRPCPSGEDVQCATCNVRKFLRGSSGSSSDMSVLDVTKGATATMPSDVSSRRETSGQSEHEDSITDMSYGEHYDRCDIIFTMNQEQVYDDITLPLATYQCMKFESGQSPNVRDSHDNNRVTTKGHTTRSLTLRRRRCVCSLEDLRRAWSFQSLLRQWRQYCRTAVQQAIQKISL